jgi:hypothetical protein
MTGLARFSRSYESPTMLIEPRCGAVNRQAGRCQLLVEHHDLPHLAQVQDSILSWGLKLNEVGTWPIDPPQSAFINAPWAEGFMTVPNTAA